MEPDDRRVGSEELLPLASIRDPITAPDALAEGPVRFLLVSGDLDDGRWGLIGAFWLSIDGSRGGFVVAPQAIWQGSEMARSFRGALSRHWHAEDVYRYWQRQVGAAGSIMIDPQQHADTLFQVARRVGAL
ncbi:MAG: hypothetical protein E6G58_00235 [Actinobacteria bacterium]|nr:MAG: hypothetical protein E6G58_00235 [Actinomycetota bacterium]